MTLAELDQSLPNGFHDAQFERIEIDYAQRRVTFATRLWTGDEVERERREQGTLVVEGLAFISMDRPDSKYPFAQREYLWVDHCPPQEKLPEGLVPDGCFASAFFVNEWNSFILVVAREARWEQGA